ncbi:hypothetical protein G3M58_21700 [Streptomyces sp. SID7499]|uniref:Uncharacterized protein n=1 Tax=Streptomyces sp. SID7499 TaxID=2706086 RepID=A0A6G3WU47_9ACTN|nr:hypothetical protein [Streptomyces sp. SID7499]
MGRSRTPTGGAARPDGVPLPLADVPMAFRAGVGFEAAIGTTKCLVQDARCVPGP